DAIRARSRLAHPEGDRLVDPLSYGNSSLLGGGEPAALNGVDGGEAESRNGGPGDAYRPWLGSSVDADDIVEDDGAAAALVSELGRVFGLGDVDWLGRRVHVFLVEDRTLWEVWSRLG